MEEQGQADLQIDRAPGAAEHRPGMMLCGAQPQVGNDGKRGRTGEDHYETASLARDRHSILNYHDGEIAAVHAATAPAVCLGPGTCRRRAWLSSSRGGSSGKRIPECNRGGENEQRRGTDIDPGPAEIVDQRA